MSVEIDPLELGFRRPFTVEVSQVLKIKNPNTAPVAFKVKTTAPKQYCVRPNSGRIEPGHEVEVSVLLQAMKQEPPLDAKCRDKFLVQSVIITADKEFTNVSQIWDSVEKSAIQEKKIRVSWLSPSHGLQSLATPVRRAGANGYDATPDTAPPTYSSPTGDDTTIADETALPSQPEPKEARQQQQQQQSPEPNQETHQQQTVFSAAGATAAAAGAAATVKSAAVETYEELKDRLAKAEATIASLKNEAASGLRQRKPAPSESEGKTSTAATTGTGAQLAQAERPTVQGTEGVPVQIVALLCLASFLLAYFLF
ncbi:VAMP-associated protein [Parathielavia appendiculata]|uniref:VAMP-associated protein n=1 Tax=Parathielavia appendiculata TaxID=2587402 RepID=A0AAN6Z284_9PEZI|nr:VAMP-associated protein [Parathielavia appendiculata]